MFIPNLKAILARAFSNLSDGATGRMEVVVGEEFAQPSRGIMVKTAGDVNFTFIDGSEGVIPELQVGIVYTIVATKVNASGTEATGIVALI
jgi:hypothetical protein